MDAKALTSPFRAVRPEGYPGDRSPTRGSKATCFLPAWEHPAMSAPHGAESLSLPLNSS